MSEHKSTSPTGITSNSTATPNTNGATGNTLLRWSKVWGGLSAVAALFMGSGVGASTTTLGDGEATPQAWLVFAQQVQQQIREHLQFGESGPTLALHYRAVEVERYEVGPTTIALWFTADAMVDRIEHSGTGDRAMDILLHQSLYQFMVQANLPDDLPNPLRLSLRWRYASPNDPAT